MNIDSSNVPEGQLDHGSFHDHAPASCAVSDLDRSMPGKRVRVLVLEDMMELADLIRECLLVQGFEVALANNGAAALQLLRDEKFEVAIVDIDLPDISGFDVVKHARITGVLRETQIVFCSGGYIQERSQIAGQFAGSRFLAKPFAIKTLLASITDALNHCP